MSTQQPARQTPKPGSLVHARSRRGLVDEVVASERGNESPLVRLACADDDAQSQVLEVYWDYELDQRILDEEAWSQLGAKGFDPPDRFAAYVHTPGWNCVTATDPNLFQAQFRGGDQGSVMRRFEALPTRVQRGRECQWSSSRAPAMSSCGRSRDL